MNITGNIAAHIPDRVDLHDGWEGCIYRTWDFPPEVIEAWDALSLGHGDMSIFVCYGWFEAWWRAFGGEHALFLAVLKRYGAIKAVFPCCVKDSPGDGAMGRSVSSLTNSHSCFYDFVIEPGVRREALANFCELVRRWNPCTQIYLDYMPRNSDNLRTLISILSRRMIPFHHYSQPWAPWSGKPGDWSAFRSSLPGRLRNTLKRNRRKAGALGQFHFEVVERSERLDEVLDVVFDIEYHSWKGRDGTAIKCLAEVEAFYRRLAHWSADRDSLILFLLKLDGIPIASDFCLRSGRTLFLLKPGYHESFQHLSPGNLLRLEVFNYFYSNPGLSTYNLLGACDPWKMEWTRNSQRYSSLLVYPKSVKGWSTYILQYGWKDYLKKFHTARTIKTWLDRRKN